MGPPNQNHYDVLQLSMDATPSQIRASYHRLARELHPDRRRRLLERRGKRGRLPQTTTLSMARAPPPPGGRPTNHEAVLVEAISGEEVLRRAPMEYQEMAPVSDEGHGGTGQLQAIDFDTVEDYYDNDDVSDYDEDEADERFRRVQDSYDCLIDPQRRKEYDDAWRLREVRARSRRRSAVELDASDCRWEAVEACEQEGGVQIFELRSDKLGAGEAVALVYSCRCGEDLYPLEEYHEDDGGNFLDCPGCSAVYSVPFVLDVALPTSS